MNKVKLYLLSGKIFKEIIYINIIDLKETLNELLENFNCDQYIQLVLNDVIINESNYLNNFDFYKVNKLEKELQIEDYIQVIFILKNSLFILNENNNFSLNEKYKNDNYYKLLEVITKDISNYYIIFNNLYIDLVSEAVKKYYDILQYTSNEMKDNYDIVSSAIEKNSYSLYYASLNMQNNKEIVLKAIRQNGNIIKYLSDDIKNDKDIILAAINQDSYSLQYASYDMKKNKDVLLTAIKRNKNVIQYANENIKNNEEIKKAIQNKDLTELENILIKLNID